MALHDRKGHHVNHQAGSRCCVALLTAVLTCVVAAAPAEQDSPTTSPPPADPTGDRDGTGAPTTQAAETADLGNLASANSGTYIDVTFVPSTGNSFVDEDPSIIEPGI